jgi:hypothetical protein
MNKSPFSPPFLPGSPSPLNTTVCSLSIPAGILTLSLAWFLTTPLPEQSGHTSLITFPSPLHLSHVVLTCVVPKIVFCTLVIYPVPLHLSHVSG